MLDRSFRPSPGLPGAVILWFVLLTDEYGNDWWAAAFPTHAEAVAYATGHPKLRGWRVELACGPLALNSPAVAEELRKEEAGDRFIKSAGPPLRTARDHRHDPQ